MAVYNEMQLSSFVDQIFERLRALEAQMARVSEAAGVSYDVPGAGVPQEVIDLVQAGDRMGARRSTARRPASAWPRRRRRSPSSRR